MFEGPWKVAKHGSLEKGVPGKGVILKHRTGAVVLRCPKCNALQFAHSPVGGHVRAPTLSKPIQCGAGHCNRCAIWFTVDAGKTVIVEGPPAKRSTPVPTRLRKAGVRPPPKLPPEHQ
jgi:hypothetical protein